MSEFQGEPTHILENRYMKLEYLANAARIVRFFPLDKENMFAALERVPLSTPYGEFFFRGGHRLWHAPEHMPRTYIPDNEGAMLSEIPNGVRAEMPPEPWTGITKAIEMELNPEKPQLILRHELRNEGAWAVELAPWALTMFRLGGVAVFPQPTGNVDEAGLLPNRRLVLWPYSNINDARLQLRDDFLLVHATAHLPPIKIGYFNPHGWIGYWLDGVFLLKRFDARENAPYPDHGCNVESYCNDRFIELETLGELTVIAPEQTIFHTEVWELHETLDETLIPLDIQSLITGKKSIPA